MEQKTIAVIISNEEVLDVPIYYEECRTNEIHHAEMINHFAKMYNLGDIDEYDLVASGHIFLRAVDDLVICYMPSIITKTQYEKLLNERKLLEQFPLFLANFYQNDDLIIENLYGDYNTKGKNILDCFYEEVTNYYFNNIKR